MPFFKKQDEILHTAPNFVVGPGFELHADTKDQHTYPVEGWYWFDTLDQAMVAMSGTTEGKVTMRQARLALLQSGLLAQVDATIAAMPGVEGAAARIEWEYATHVERNSPLVSGLSAALGLTSAQLDSLFTLATTL